MNIVRAALYIRVSHEEQAMKGLSLEAQQERLVEFARSAGWSIVGIYTDAGKTARKNMSKRSEFNKMLEAVKRDEVDMLVFCKLDRWFRSVADYYKVMEVLDAHGCGWRTIDEDYDTTTASGQLFINLKLSIAQNEADTTGERIKVVLDSKVRHGTTVSGSVPYGYRIGPDKRLVIVPEEAAVVRAVFDYYEATCSMYDAYRYARTALGYKFSEAAFRRIFKKERYIGAYNAHGRINENYCPAIVSKEQFERVQVMLRRNAYHSAKNIYLFTSIIKCQCGSAMTGYVGRGNYYYRCASHYKYGDCRHAGAVREDKVERYLLDHVSAELDRVEAEWNIKNAKRAACAHPERAALKRKISKLKELYVNDLISIEDYKKDYERYNAELDAIKEGPVESAPDFKRIRALLAQGFSGVYAGLSRTERRTFWRSIIRQVVIDDSNDIVGFSFL